MRLVRFPRGGSDDDSRTRLRWAARTALGSALAVGIALGTFAVIWLTGGLPNVYANLNYLPIILAGYLFGWRGAVAVALLEAYLMGPHAAVVGVPGSGDTRTWVLRAATYLVVAAIVGALFDRLRSSVDHWRRAAQEVTDERQAAMVALARAAEAKDADTHTHMARVRLLSERVALAAGADAEAAERIGWAAVVHDVGKLQVADEILRKPGPLTPGETRIMREHTLFGEHILACGSGFDLARRIARSHHENYDGTGYPDGLAGKDIPFEARIVRVVDSFDAMTSNRPYRSARSIETAFDELGLEAGRLFDPEIVPLLTALVSSDERLRAQLLAPTLVA
jgi:hypothetical protein